MPSDAPPFDRLAFERRLTTRTLGRPLLVLAACGSTNDELSRAARDGATEGTLVLAETQTGGRGRAGRNWHSPTGDNLYLSLLLRPDRPATDLPPLALLAGAVLARTIDETAPARHGPARVKWPNDVLLPVAPEDPPEGSVAPQYRKTAGILIEMTSEGGTGGASAPRARHVILGIGLNVNQSGFPPELVGRATSLSLAAGQRFEREAVLADFLARFEPAYHAFIAQGPGYAVQRFREHALFGQPCTVEGGAPDGGDLSGVTHAVDNDGALVVTDALGGLHRVVSGEVVVTQKLR